MSSLIPAITTLPTELLYDIQSLALSDSFPFSSRRILLVFHSSPPSFRAGYIFGRVISASDSSNILTRALRYPLCSVVVFDAFCKLLQNQNFCRQRFSLPRRLFRNLPSKFGSAVKWKDRDYPLPFLRHLYQSPCILLPNADEYQGYALTKAIAANHLPLVKFLLDHGASPHHKNCLAVLIAIRKKDLSLVKLLIERHDSFSSDSDVIKKTSFKRRKLEDRVKVNQQLLKVAVQCDAEDIVDYLMNEKGCAPDLQTVLLSTSHAIARTRKQIDA